jgi:ABC-type sulfate/molybdate transport systems ATPase subunit
MRAVNRVGFDVRQGVRLGLLEPYGSGEPTVLRLVADLEHWDHPGEQVSCTSR